MDKFMRETGIYQTLGEVKYFIPHSLPPSNPSFEFNSEIISLYGEAIFALGKLNEMSRRVPDTARFIKAYVIKEALLSSAIEGIHTTLLEVFTHQLGDTKISKDTQLVMNYTSALDAALHLIQTENMPLATRVILKAHEALMSCGDGDKAAPGNFRRISVKVGELVPAPATEVPHLMGNLEKYINDIDEMPLIKAGLAHVHFETIHPFLDGNGRIGRLLIVLMLINSRMLDLPILYPSYYFKKNHFEYYHRLDRVRTHGDFEGWICYYLKAIRDSSEDALSRAKSIEDLEETFTNFIKTNERFKATQDTAISALKILFSQPVIGTQELSQRLGKSYNTTHSILKEFVTCEIVAEKLLGKSHKLYRFEPYLRLLEKEY